MLGFFKNNGFEIITSLLFIPIFFYIYGIYTVPTGDNNIDTIIEATSQFADFSQLAHPLILIGIFTLPLFLLFKNTLHQIFLRWLTTTLVMFLLLFLSDMLGYLDFLKPYFWIPVLPIVILSFVFRRSGRISRDLFFTLLILSSILSTTSIFEYLSSYFDMVYLTNNDRTSLSFFMLDEIHPPNIKYIFQYISSSFWLYILCIANSHTAPTSTKTVSSFLKRTDNNPYLSTAYYSTVLLWFLIVVYSIWATLSGDIADETISDLSKNGLSLLLYYITFILLSGRFIIYHRVVLLALLAPEVLTHLLTFLPGSDFNGIEATLVSELDEWFEFIFINIGLMSHSDNPQIIKVYWLGIVTFASIVLKVFRPNSIRAAFTTLFCLSMLVSVITFHAIIVNSANNVHQAKTNQFISQFMSVSDFMDACKERSYVCSINDINTNFTPTDKDLLPIHDFYLSKPEGSYAKTLISIKGNDDFLKTIGYYKNELIGEIRVLVAYNIDVIRFNFIKALFYILAIIYSVVWLLIIDFLLKRHKIKK